MDRERLDALLRAVAAGRTTPEEAREELARLPFRRDGDLALDHHRELRCGEPEVVLGAGKTPEQVVAAARALAEAQGRVLVTRLDPEAAAAVQSALPEAEHDAAARTVTWVERPAPPLPGRVLVVSAGASDLPVAAEAAVTARFLGATTEALTDVGVAGLPRLLAEVERLRTADVLVVAAGMEGALPSVVAGLVAAPVVAVPTSVGYGASFGGLAALLAMLNACAPGISVVNLDNGFGAAVSAVRILRAARDLHAPDAPCSSPPSP